MIACYDCVKNKSKEVCGACREVLKFDLVNMVLGMDRVYLSESSRNKKGRPSVTNDEKIRYAVAKAYKKHESYRKVGEMFGMSKSSVGKIIKGYGENMKYVE